MYRLLLTLLIITTLLSVGCTSLGGTEIGNPQVVSGTIVDSLGAPVPGVTVNLVPATYNPVTKAGLITGITDASGQFSLTGIEGEQYALFGNNTEEMVYRRRLLPQRVGDTISLVDTLLPLETLTVSLENSEYDPSGVLYIKGTLLTYGIMVGDNIIAVPRGLIGLSYLNSTTGEKLSSGPSQDSLLIEEGSSILLKKHTISTPDKLIGQVDVTQNSSHEYSTNEATSALGHPLEYRFGYVLYTGQAEWWDFAILYPWQREKAFTFTFPDTGEYKLRVQARSIYHHESISEWSTYRQVMSK